MSRRSRDRDIEVPLQQIDGRSCLEDNGELAIYISMSRTVDFLIAGPCL